jgi:hypothetical protein
VRSSSKTKSDDGIRTAFITLYEALTWLAFDQPGRAEEERMRYSRQNDKIRHLIDSCITEAARKKNFEAYPRRLPFNPLTVLIKRLKSAQPPYPTQHAALLRAATRLLRERQRRSDRISSALNRILEAARAGYVELRGRSSPDQGSRVHPIPLDFLLADITIDHSLRHLAHAINAEDPTSQRAIILSQGKFSDAYYRIQVNRSEFLLHLKGGYDKPKDTTLKHLTDKDFRDWYKSVHLPHWKSRREIPSEKQEYEAARKHVYDLSGQPAFPKLRDLLRTCRAEYAPSSWHKRGRRPKKRLA